MKVKQVIQNLKTQGIAKNRKDTDFCPIELEAGTIVEKEHSDNKEIAKEVAKDHLAENPHYYTSVLGPAEKEVMEKVMKVLKKHGYSSVKEFLADSKKKGMNEATCTIGDVIAFLKKNPNPSDEKLHDWAEGKGFNVHKVEQLVYQLATKYVRGR